jgi:hypothetical protein
MRIQYVLHADFERPGYIEHWARGRTFSQAYCRPFAGERLPAATTFDVLIVMGGPQSPLALEDASERNCAADLAPGTYVQSAEQMLSADLREVNARVAMLLDNFLSIRK